MGHDVAPGTTRKRLVARGQSRSGKLIVIPGATKNWLHLSVWTDKKSKSRKREPQSFGANITTTRAWAKVGPHGVFCDRKRYGARQETVTAGPRSRGTMYRKELVSKPVRG